ncbi:MAG TPA: hypothetical protein ENJ06_04085 [Phycisphaeraceae bacterium]|nr:hypothetical protein [Phycisphaeraceae bacterium]
MSRGLLKSVTLILLLLLAVPVSRAADKLTSEEIQQLFSEANRDYSRAVALRSKQPDAASELFRRAIASWRTIITRGGIENGYLRYNMGNAYLLMNDVGRALVNYKKAQRTIPGYPDLKRNLQIARSRTADQIEPASGQGMAVLWSWHKDIPAKVRFTVGTITFALMWLLLFLRVVGLLRFRITALVLIFACIWGLCAASLVSEELDRVSRPEAVIVAREVVGRQGPGNAGYDESFNRPLHAGVEVRLLEKRAGWVRVQLPDKSTTWLPQNSVEII